MHLVVVLWTPEEQDVLGVSRAREVPSGMDMGKRRWPQAASIGGKG